ncbi:MAG TPA: adenylate/guanylate cyclase domain-containing protein [Cyanobacteria bacterium UBA8803]|nr:adenylate/guanylate cyclase domain-containing protein [Cyanobacteria bacterium UBA9273]HBL58648.1 adenylate/guanylate cyclase domain-containing protein [Cyanobacteria bacterium UBA8803]
MQNRQDLDVILLELLKEINHRLQKVIAVDRTTIFLLDQQNPEVCSILCSDCPHLIELRIPIHKGRGDKENFKQFVNTAFDCSKHQHHYCPKKRQDATYYIAYNLLALPIKNSQKYPIAFVQFINKLNEKSNPEDSLYQRVDRQGFTPEDEKRLARATAAMHSMVERCQSLYAQIKKQRAIVAFIKAIHEISQGGLDLEATMQLIVDEAKTLIDADRSRLWLIDRERQELWTKVPISDSSFKELRLPMGSCFVGQVAKSCQPINIPFDLYVHPNSEPIQRLDRHTDYRSCSLLCLPVFNAHNELLGVMELTNKKRPGHFPDYNPEDWPVPPEGFKSSFSQADRHLMSAFTMQAGIALQNAQLFTTLKQQEQIQRNIFRSLDKSVICTDRVGRILTFNERAKQLLNISDDEQLQGHYIRELVQIQEGNLIEWCQQALAGDGQQYHPNQTLISRGQEHKIHLSINAIADTSNGNHLNGLLVVMEEMSNNQHLRSTSERPISQELTQEWLRNRNGTSLTPENVSVVCSDLRGYTNLIEDMEPEEVVALLNQYFELMVEAVMKYQGALDKYIGDALIAVFGMPLPLHHRAWYSVQTALEMRHRLAEFNSRHFPQKQHQLRIGIGIHSGQMSHDTISSEPNVSNDVVNFTSLLEHASREYNCDIIISEMTYRQCGDRIWARELDRLQVKGKKRAVAIYELIGLRSQPLSEPQQQIVEHYRKGRHFYLNHQFALAMSEFAKVLSIDNNDKAARLHIQRCLHWLKSPPPAD